MLSILNAMWFVRICSMILKGLQRRKAPSTVFSDMSAHKQINSDKKAQGAVMDHGDKGATDTLQIHKQRHANGITAVK